MSAFWYQTCPKCDGMGRLVVKKYNDYNELFLCCDECMACWKTISDLHNNRNLFYEFMIKSNTTYATIQDIREQGWDIEVKKYVV